MTREEIARACVQDMLFFGKACLPRLFVENSPPMHHEIRDALQNEDIELLNIIAPRGHAKTTLVGQLWPLWRIFCLDAYMGRRWKPKFTLLISKSRGHAVNTLTTIKNILEYNDHFKAIFGYHGSQNAKAWREDMIRLDNGSVIVCRGWEQQIRGLNIDGMRPDCAIGDDIETEDNTKTPESIQKTFDRFVQAVVPALAKGGRACNVGTPQVANSLVFTLGEMSNWKTLRYKAINTNDEGREYALWPSVMPLSKLKERRDALEDVGRVSAFYREYQCEVIGDADQLFRPDYIQYWRGEWGRDVHGKAYVEVLGEKRPVNIYMGVDPASTLTARSDYTVIMVVAMDAERNYYVLDYLRRRMQPMDVAEHIVTWCKRFKPEKAQIESTGYQEMLRQYLKREMGFYQPGLEIKNTPRMGKSKRLEGLQPIFATGKVYLRTEIPEDHSADFDMNAFRDELLLFPRAKHDDTLDAFFYAVKGAYPPYHTELKLEGSDTGRTFERTPVYNWKVL